MMVLMGYWVVGWTFNTQIIVGFRLVCDRGKGRGIREGNLKESRTRIRVVKENKNHVKLP